MIIRFLLALCSLLPLSAIAQQTFPQSAPTDPRTGLFAFTNATIYLDYKTRLEGATLLIRDGRVVSCGQTVTVPKEAVVQDCTGKTIYPAFIDLYAAGYGLPSPRAEGAAPQQKPQSLTNKKGAYAWNEALKPEFNANENFALDAKAAEEWRKFGFGAVLTHRADGIDRGTGALVSLADAREHTSILLSQASHHLSFRKGTSTQENPTSLMGCIALLRQTYLDAQWYQTEGYKTEQNLSLAAWNRVQTFPQIFEASDKLDLLRIARLGQEFGIKYMVKTVGDEYQRLEAIQATGAALIVPLNFPENYDVRDPYDAMNISLHDLKHWEMAPANPARLEAAGINFALTTNGLREKSKFMENLRKAIEYGLTEETALKALTYNPAVFINAYTVSALNTPGATAGIGSLEPGKTANFLLTSGNIFKADTKIFQNWVQGKLYDLYTPGLLAASPNRLGDYRLEVGSETYTLSIKGKPESPDAQIIKSDSSKVKANLSALANGVITLYFQPDTLKKGFVSLSGTAGATEWAGRGTLQDGTWTNWKATFLKAAEPPKPVKQNPVVNPVIGDMLYPFVAFGWKDQPKAQTVLVQNTTVWTNEKDGILTNTDVLFSNGKIQKIGRKLAVPDQAMVIDGTGKHLTAGIIDEHSHIAIARSVNEGSQECTAEVRIGDVLDCEDVDIYRQLAGGVTSSHLLHGSANPIGGQTQLIKLRWGYAPEDLKFQNWPGFIKFALGENVKQSNWGDDWRARYPQSRMGVEQVYEDYFTRAQAYGKLKKSGKIYRKDLEMEALLEILESNRFITCHSYVQSEITMLMRVAEQFNFKINTFTHILEGYKVADKMAKHGVGGSTFSDWWAYKYEVYQAIPYNAKMMADRGVTVAINSDDAEMARRLNQEAAKSVRYGGMKEIDAWKMVTLNPAKLLHVDDRVGSIKVGKDADLVLWNDHPLSVYASADKTWVDGILFFDRQQDAQLRDTLRIERSRLIQKMQGAKKPAEGTESKPTPPKQHYHCDDNLDEG